MGAALALWAGKPLEPAAAETGTDATAWKPRGPSRCFRQFNLDWSWISLRPEEIGAFFQETSPQAIADFLAGSNVDGVVVMAVPHHGYCTHQTRVGERFPSLHYDWFGAMVGQLHRRQISAFGYVTLNWNWKYIREHLGADYIHGKPDDEGVCGNRVMICLNAPGFLELVEAYTAEVMSQYPVDGMRWDILKTVRGCRCAGCQKLYRELWGESWPSVAALPAEVVDELYDRTVERVVRRLYRLCKQIRPEVEVWQNHLNPYFPNPLHLAREMDVAYNEFGDPVRLLVIRGASGRAAVINGLMNQAPTTPPQPIDTMAWRLTLALGGRCYSYYGHRHTNPRTLLPDESIRRWHREQLAPFYRMVREIQPWLEGAEPVSDLAILFCDRTRLRFPRRDRTAYLQAMEPWMARLIQDGRPPKVVDVADLGKLLSAGADWSLLIVPMTSGLLPEELDRLRQFIDEGGTLLVAGDALRHDPRGKPLADFALAEEMGIRWLGEVPEANAVRYDFSGPVKFAGGVPSPKSLVRVQPVRGQTWVWAELVGGERVPVVHSLSHERGRCVWVATLDEQILYQILWQLAPVAPLRMATGGGQAVVCFQEISRRWIVHLLSSGELSFRLDRRWVPANRISAQYPASGWEVRLNLEGDYLCVQASGGAEYRLLVLEGES
jgi:hypothetical protein